MNKTVAVIGGGAGGLYVARLLKLAQPSLDVTVYERMDGTADTFGFGVGLTGSTMRNLEAADPETAEQIRAASYSGHELHLRKHDSDVPLHGARNLAIGRPTILRILAEAATQVGVAICEGQHADVDTLDADVIIAADGVGSSTREKYTTELGATSSVGRTYFVWCGADFAVDTAFFAARQRGESLFVAHAYPYAPDRSTFLIEADNASWYAAGLENYARQVSAGHTDRDSVSLLQEVFNAELGGRPLLTNRTQWSRFVNLALQRWSIGNVVLLGDAAHTAHYTLGSGTKLALEDAIALAHALTGEASVQEAFDAYEQTRRPPVERFQILAQRSQAWWDSYRLRHHWPIDQLALSFMTRAGNLMLRDFANEQPEVTQGALSQFGLDAPGDPEIAEKWLLEQPLAHRSLALPHRWLSRDCVVRLPAIHEMTWREPDVWGQAADNAVAELQENSSPVLVTAHEDGNVSGRVDFAERLRLELDQPVGVELPSDQRALAATTIAAGRADFAVHH